MAAPKLSVKHIQISKTNTVISITLAIAAFLTIFSLVASKALLAQQSYNSKVIKQKELAVKTLESNIVEAEKLAVSYKEFISRDTNVIGGESAGASDRDGDNAKLILDALPSTYDFPAVASSLEKILTQKNLSINQITGTDDEIAQADQQASANPTVVEIPYTFSVSGSYDAMHDLIQSLEYSIRPMHIMKLDMNANNKDVQMTITGKTFYQSEKKFDITKEVVK
jgi:hypothetical protein